MDEPLCTLVCAPLKVEKPHLSFPELPQRHKMSRRKSCERSLARMIDMGLDLKADNAIRDHKHSGN